MSNGFLGDALTNLMNAGLDHALSKLGGGSAESNNQVEDEEQVEDGAQVEAQEDGGDDDDNPIISALTDIVKQVISDTVTTAVNQNLFYGNVQANLGGLDSLQEGGEAPVQPEKTKFAEFASEASSERKGRAAFVDFFNGKRRISVANLQTLLRGNIEGKTPEEIARMPLKGAELNIDMATFEALVDQVPPGQDGNANIQSKLNRGYVRFVKDPNSPNGLKLEAFSKGKAHIWVDSRTNVTPAHNKEMRMLFADTMLKEWGGQLGLEADIDELGNTMKQKLIAFRNKIVGDGKLTTLLSQADIKEMLGDYRAMFTNADDNRRIGEEFLQKCLTICGIKDERVEDFLRNFSSALPENLRGKYAGKEAILNAFVNAQTAGDMKALMREMAGAFKEMKVAYLHDSKVSHLLDVLASRPFSTDHVGSMVRSGKLPATLVKMLDGVDLGTLNKNALVTDFINDVLPTFFKDATRELVAAAQNPEISPASEDMENLRTRAKDKLSLANFKRVLTAYIDNVKQWDANAQSQNINAFDKVTAALQAKKDQMLQENRSMLEKVQLPAKPEGSPEVEGAAKSEGGKNADEAMLKSDEDLLRFMELSPEERKVFQGKMEAIVGLNQQINWLAKVKASYDPSSDEVLKSQFPELSKSVESSGEDESTKTRFIDILKQGVATVGDKFKKAWFTKDFLHGQFPQTFTDSSVQGEQQKCEEMLEQVTNQFQSMMKQALVCNLKDEGPGAMGLQELTSRLGEMLVDRETQKAFRDAMVDGIDQAQEKEALDMAKINFFNIVSAMMESVKGSAVEAKLQGVNFSSQVDDKSAKLNQIVKTLTGVLTSYKSEGLSFIGIHAKIMGSVTRIVKEATNAGWINEEDGAKLVGAVKGDAVKAMGSAMYEFCKAEIEDMLNDPDPVNMEKDLSQRLKRYLNRAVGECQRKAVEYIYSNVFKYDDPEKLAGIASGSIFSNTQQDPISVGVEYRDKYQDQTVASLIGDESLSGLGDDSQGLDLSKADVLKIMDEQKASVWKNMFATNVPGVVGVNLLDALVNKVLPEGVLDRLHKPSTAWLNGVSEAFVKELKTRVSSFVQFQNAFLKACRKELKTALEQNGCFVGLADDKLRDEIVEDVLNSKFKDEITQELHHFLTKPSDKNALVSMDNYAGALAKDMLHLGVRIGEAGRKVLDSAGKAEQDRAKVFSDQVACGNIFLNSGVKTALGEANEVVGKRLDFFQTKLESPTAGAEVQNSQLFKDAVATVNFGKGASAAFVNGVKAWAANSAVNAAKHDLKGFCCATGMPGDSSKLADYAVANIQTALANQVLKTYQELEVGLKQAKDDILKSLPQQNDEARAAVSRCLDRETEGILKAFVWRACERSVQKEGMTVTDLQAHVLGEFKNKLSGVAKSVQDNADKLTRLLNQVLLDGAADLAKTLKELGADDATIDDFIRKPADARVSQIKLQIVDTLWKSAFAEKMSDDGLDTAYGELQKQIQNDVLLPDSEAKLKKIAGDLNVNGNDNLTQMLRKLAPSLGSLDGTVLDWLRNNAAFKEFHAHAIRMVLANPSEGLDQALMTSFTEMKKTINQVRSQQIFVGRVEDYKQDVLEHLQDVCQQRQNALRGDDEKFLDALTDQDWEELKTVFDQAYSDEVAAEKKLNNGQLPEVFDNDPEAFMWAKPVGVAFSKCFAEAERRAVNHKLTDWLKDSSTREALVAACAKHDDSEEGFTLELKHRFLQQVDDAFMSNPPCTTMAEFNQLKAEVESGTIAARLRDITAVKNVLDAAVAKTATMRAEIAFNQKRSAWMDQQCDRLFKAFVANALAGLGDDAVYAQNWFEAYVVGMAEKEGRSSTPDQIALRLSGLLGLGSAETSSFLQAVTKIQEEVAAACPKFDATSNREFKDPTDPALPNSESMESVAGLLTSKIRTMIDGANGKVDVTLQTVVSTAVGDWTSDMMDTFSKYEFVNAELMGANKSALWAGINHIVEKFIEAQKTEWKKNSVELDLNQPISAKEEKAWQAKVVGELDKFWEQGLARMKTLHLENFNDDKYWHLQKALGLEEVTDANADENTQRMVAFGKAFEKFEADQDALADVKAKFQSLRNACFSDESAEHIAKFPLFKSVDNSELSFDAKLNYAQHRVKFAKLKFDAQSNLMQQMVINTWAQQVQRKFFPVLENGVAAIEERIKKASSDQEINQLVDEAEKFVERMSRNFTSFINSQEFTAFNARIKAFEQLFVERVGLDLAAKFEGHIEVVLMQEKGTEYMEIWRHSAQLNPMKKLETLKQAGMSTDKYGNLIKELGVWQIGVRNLVGFYIANQLEISIDDDPGKSFIRFMKNASHVDPLISLNELGCLNLLLANSVSLPLNSDLKRKVLERQTQLQEMAESIVNLGERLRVELREARKILEKQSKS